MLLFGKEKNPQIVNLATHPIVCDVCYKHIGYLADVVTPIGTEPSRISKFIWNGHNEGYPLRIICEDCLNGNKESN